MKYKVCCLAIFTLFSRGYSTVSQDVSDLQKEHFVGNSSRLELVSVENSTDGLEFQIFPPLKESVGLSLSMATLFLVDEKNKGISLDKQYPLIIKCSKGSYQSVFIKDGHAISGKALDGYDGPFSISMWLPYPSVAESSKLHISYVVKKGKLGKIGIKIGPKGDYRLVAVSDVRFIH